MRVLAISHACSVDTNRELFVHLAGEPGLHVMLLVPANWRSDLTGDAYVSPSSRRSALLNLCRSPVRMPGHVWLHSYRSMPLSAIRAFRPDVVYLDEEPWSLAAWQATRLCASIGVPLVFHSNQNLVKRYPPPFRWIEQFTFARAAAACPSHSQVLAVLRARGYRGPATVVPYAAVGVPQGPADSQDLRGQMGVSGLVVGYLGRLVPEKGLDTLLAAVRLLGNDPTIPPFSTLIVGGGEPVYEAELRRLAEGIPNVRFHPAVPHAAAVSYLQCMDILVLPSRATRRWREQFGRVLVESLAVGVPVVGSSSGAIPGVIGDTGGGLVFREGVAQDLADKLGMLVRDKDLRLRLATAGQVAVMQRYTNAAVAAQLLDILERSVRRSVSPAPRSPLAASGTPVRSEYAPSDSMSAVTSQLQDKEGIDEG